MRDGLADIGPGEIVLVGYSMTFLEGIAGHLPPGSVLVVEDPAVAANRNVAAAVAANPLTSGLLLAEYQRPDEMEALLDREPMLKAAQAIVPGGEYPMGATARLADLLRLPGARTDAAAVFRDKARQRELAAAVGLRNPRHAVVSCPAEAAAFVERVGGRCVVKPTGRQASLGVRFVRPGSDEAALAFRHAATADEANVPTGGIRSRVIVEEAVEGREYSVEVLFHDGRPCFANVTAKRLVPGEFPVELGHTVPGMLDEMTRDLLVDGTVRLAEAAGFGSGALHAEWIVDADGPVLVECAGRMPGDEIPQLISLAYDRSFVRAYLTVLLGDDPRLPAHPTYGAAIRFLTAEPGTVHEVAGVAAASVLPGVVSVKVTAAPGDTVHPVRSSWDRIGQVVVRTANPCQAEEVAERAARTIEVVTVSTVSEGLIPESRRPLDPTTPAT